MALLDFLTRLFFRGDKIECPSCRADGALETRDGLVHCRNRDCPNYDPGYVIGGRLVRRYTELPTRGNFQPENPVSIRYVNFVGQSRDFSAEKISLVRKRNHIVAQVAPTGRKITLSRDRIQNLSEVEGLLPSRVETGQNWPKGRELQILNYHKKHGTTSPRNEELRAKYPNW